MRRHSRGRHAPRAQHKRGSPHVAPGAATCAGRTSTRPDPHPGGPPATQRQQQAGSPGGPRLHAETRPGRYQPVSGRTRVSSRRVARTAANALAAPGPRNGVPPECDTSARIPRPGDDQWTRRSSPVPMMAPPAQLNCADTVDALSVPLRHLEGPAGSPAPAGRWPDAAPDGKSTAGAGSSRDPPPARFSPSIPGIADAERGDRTTTDPPRPGAPQERRCPVQRFSHSIGESPPPHRGQGGMRIESATSWRQGMQKPHGRPCIPCRRWAR